MVGRLLLGPVRCEAVVDLDVAAVGNDIAGDPAVDADGIEAFPVVTPSMDTRRASYDSSRLKISPAAWIALTPSQDRAEWARRPSVRMMARILPWQPASTTPYVGSSSIAKSASSQCGWLRLTWFRPLRSASTSSQS